MRLRVPIAASLLASALTGCTAVDMARLPTVEKQGDVFVTEASVRVPYESLGIIQVTRKGVLLFGFGDPAGTDLASAMEQILPEIRRAGADGLMNARVEMTQYTTISKIFGAILFIFPLPSEVTITGELVRLRGEAAVVPVTAPTGGRSL